MGAPVISSGRWMWNSHLIYLRNEGVVSRLLLRPEGGEREKARIVKGTYGER